MQFRVIEDARDGLWRWILLENGRAVARSLEAFGNPDSCRSAVRRMLNEHTVVEEAPPAARTGRARVRAAAQSVSAEGAAQYEDVGLKKNAEPTPEEGEAARGPLPQIGR